MSQSYEITGRIVYKGDTEIVGAKEFKKRAFVLETPDEKYPQQIKLELIKDGCAKLDQYMAGDIITASFNLQGREYNGKYYVNLQAWKISGDASNNQARPAQQANAPKAAQPTASADDFDDVPF